MAVKDIRQLGDPILWQVSEDVIEFSSEDLRALVRDLDDTLSQFRRDHGFGRGIAAPQIGELQRVIFVRMQPSGFCGPLVNPIVTWHSEDRVDLWDGCFSFPDLVVKVNRAARIRVAYQDESGASHTLEAFDDLSELLQHEIDHLDGILATDRALSSKALMTREQWSRGI